MIKILAYRIDIVIATVAYSLLSVFFYFNQKECSFNNGLEWDGVYYAEATEDFAKKERPNTIAPFGYRIGIPFIASLMPQKTKLAWLLLGVIFSAITFILLYFLLTLYLKDKWARFALLMFYIINFRSPVRAIWYAPVSTDYFDKFFLILGLIFLFYIKSEGWTKARSLSFTILIYLGVLCREIVGVLAVASIFATNPIKFDSEKRNFYFSQIPILSLFPVLGFFLAFLTTKLLVDPIPNPQFQGFAQTSIYWIFTKSFPDYLLAILIAFSPAILNIIITWKKQTKFLFEFQHLSIYTFLFLLLGYFGGSATHRLIYWAIPAVLIMLGKSFEEVAIYSKRNRLFYTFLVLFILLSQRVFWLIPDYPNHNSTNLVFLTPLTNNINLLDLIGMGSLKVRFLSLVSYLFAIFFLFYIYLKKSDN